jgi:hypothetical protein
MDDRVMVDVTTHEPTQFHYERMIAMDQIAKLVRHGNKDASTLLEQIFLCKLMGKKNTRDLRTEFELPK